MIILGIDPGIATLGFGVIEKDEKGSCRAVDYGVVKTPKEETLPVRLALLEKGVSEIIEKYKPDEVAMEELFFTKNITTGIAVAHARGVAMLCCVKECGRLFEYTPMQIKQALTGYGRADKQQIQQVVTSLLKLKTVPKPDDAADALGVALCHAFASRFANLFAVGNSTRTKGNNAVSGSEYQKLMEEENKKSRKNSAKSAFSNGASASELAKSTGLAGITGVGRAGSIKR